jgi:hypothetical protein
MLDLEGNPIKPPPKCIHCKKTEGEHNAKTRECPVGLKTRIGYIRFGPTVFEIKS